MNQKETEIALGALVLFFCLGIITGVIIRYPFDQNQTNQGIIVITFEAQTNALLEQDTTPCTLTLDLTIEQPLNATAMAIQYCTTHGLIFIRLLNVLVLF